MVKVCIAGKNSIAINAILYLLENYISNDELAVIANLNDNGMDSWQPSLVKFAKECRIAQITLEDAYKIPNLLFISLEFDRIIKPDLFQSKRLFNIHFSKLPKFKGVYTSITPILCGELESGVTLHKIDSGIDTGDIIAQKTFRIPLEWNARDLYFKYLEYGFLLFCENIESLLKNCFRAIPQSPFGSYYSRTCVDVKNIRIDLKKTSFEIHNQLRAFIFKEYQLPKINNICIAQSILRKEKIVANTLVESRDRFILSGIDGFKVEAYKSLRGGGNYLVIFTPLYVA